MKRRRKHYDRAWAVWTLAGVALETAAIRTGDPDTPLSGQTRRVLGLGHPNQIRDAAGKGVLLGTLAWAWFHLCKRIERMVTS